MGVSPWEIRYQNSTNVSTNTWLRFQCIFVDVKRNKFPVISLKLLDFIDTKRRVEIDRISPCLTPNFLRSPQGKPDCMPAQMYKLPPLTLVVPHVRFHSQTALRVWIPACAEMTGRKDAVSGKSNRRSHQLKQGIRVARALRANSCSLHVPSSQSSRG